VWWVNKNLFLQREEMSTTEPHGQWFDEARLGLFIHWGAYSVAGRGEWVMNRERIPLDEYREEYVKNFKAEKFDPDQWAQLALDAGMKYVVLTTRHHDGFALWDTKTTDYNAAKLGPERDLIMPYAQSMRKYGLKVGLYYSVADWSHPDYPAFERDWPQGWASEEARQRFVNHYHAQLEELMTQYGTIDLLWYDGCTPQPLDGDVINTKIKQWQPGIMINARNGEPCDFAISEKSLKAKDGRWEACFNVNDSWGYHRGATQWKTPKEMILMLLETAKNAGNLLLNLGPLPCGTMPPEGVTSLQQVGQWLKTNGEFLSNSSRSPFTWNNCSIVTTKDNHVYLHLHRDPGEVYCFADLANKVKCVTQLDNGKQLAFKQQDDRLFITGFTPPDAQTITTIRVEVEGSPQTVKTQTSFWIMD
jgi:alpha-L-fucosidase